MMPAAAREFLAKSNEYKARQIETIEKNKKKGEEAQQTPPRQRPLGPSPHKAAAKDQPKVGDAKSVAEMMQKAWDFSKEQQQQQQQIGNEASRKGKEQASVQPVSNTKRTLQFSAAAQEPKQPVSFEELVVSLVENKVLSGGGKEMVELLACVDDPKFSDDDIVKLAVFACREYFLSQSSQSLAMLHILGEQPTMQGIMRSVPQPVASFFIEKAYIHVAGLLLDSVVALAAADKSQLPWWLQPDMLAECAKAAKITEDAETTADAVVQYMPKRTEAEIQAANNALQAAEEAKKKVFQPRKFPCLANIALLKEIRRLPYCRMQSALASESEAAGTKRGRETVQDNMALLFADDSLRNISSVWLQQENSQKPRAKNKPATKLAEWVCSVPTPQNPAAMAGLVFPHKHPIYSPHVLLGNVLARLYGRPWAQAHLLHTFASTKADEDSENPIFENITSVVLNKPMWKNNPLPDERFLQQKYNGAAGDKRVAQYAEYLQRCFATAVH